MRLCDLIGPDDIRFLQATDAAGVVRELGLELAPRARMDGERLVEMLRRREHVGSTAVGQSLAIPHARAVEAAETGAGVGLSGARGALAAPDGQLVHVFVALVSPIHGGRHLHVIATVARELGDVGLCRRLVAAGGVEEAYRLLGGWR